MRNFPPRPILAPAVQKRLQEKTDLLVRITDEQERKKTAHSAYESARKSKWFKPVLDALRSLCGKCDLCMYCSANEPSNVEHYHPLSVFPEQAFHYENYLWTCEICNRTYKGERFPPDTEPGEQILNPLDDNVWDYFFLDEHFGRLIKRVDPLSLNPMPRAVSTCNVVGIDRENVQIRRQKRFRWLRKSMEDSLNKFRAGTLSQAELQAEIAELRAEPFQADVADYFLKGPGRVHEPFRSALSDAGETVQ